MYFKSAQPLEVYACMAVRCFTLCKVEYLKGEQPLENRIVFLQKGIKISVNTIINSNKWSFFNQTLQFISRKDILLKTPSIAH